MKKTIALILFILATAFPVLVFAQCPPSITASVVTTDASCPSSGSATVSIAETGSVTCTMLTGPAGATLNVPQSNPVFNALLPGNYTVRVYCLGLADTVSFTIHDSYTPISHVSATVTISCSSYSPSGTVTIAATGGNAPLSYSIIKSVDPNYPDSISVYSSSATKTVSSYGSYQVRVKDACNQFYTVTTQVNASLNPVVIALSPSDAISCAPTSRIFFCQLLDAVTNVEIDSSIYNAVGNVKLNLYEQAAGTCSPTGPLLATVSHAPTHGSVLFPVVSSRKYFIQLITPCGDTTNTCYDDPSDNSFFSMKASVTGCGTGSSPFTETIKPDQFYTGNVYPVTVNLYAGTSASGSPVATGIANNYWDIWNPAGPMVFSGLTPGTYFMSSVDACGHTNTQVINNPAGAGAPAISFQYFNTGGCMGGGFTTLSGRATILAILQGYLPDFSSSSVVVITAGPGSIGDTAYVSGTDLQWTNLLPGTYTATVHTGCGTTNLQFVVPNDPNNLLKQNIAATASSTCGAGSGQVTAVTDYNGGQTKVFVLVDAATHAAIDSNTNGTFNSVAPGQYFVRMKLVNNSYCPGAGYEINSNTITIAASAGGPPNNKENGYYLRRPER